MSRSKGCIRPGMGEPVVVTEPRENTGSLGGCKTELMASSGSVWELLYASDVEEKLVCREVEIGLVGTPHGQALRTEEE